MVNLKEKPYYLNDEQIKWVEDTILNMSDEEKVGQLFVNLVGSLLGKSEFKGQYNENVFCGRWDTRL